MRYRIRVFGRVQGVYYRKSTQLKAQSLGLTGYVKNEMEGSVLIEAEGLKQGLDELLNWTKIGPEMASVTNVVCHEIPNQDSLDFELRY